MKTYKLLSVFIAIVLLMVSTVPASAQLGTTNGSSFTIQNVDTTNAQVTVIFVDKNGTPTTPSVLNRSQPNPFTLGPSQSFEVVVEQVPGLASGSYSVVVGSTAKVIAIANLVGRGTASFNGSYQGFSAGASPFYLPGVVYNYYGWYSLISVQNLGTGNADITVTMKCTNNGLTGTLTATGVKPNASHTFVLKPGQTDTVTPTGFTTSTSCNGAATITANQPVVATDNQSSPSTGRTQSYSGISSGAPTLFVPALYHNYYGWTSSLNIQKLSSGTTTVTVTYSNGGTNTCNLTNTSPACLLIMAQTHAINGYFAAKVTSSPAATLVAIANAANGSNNQAQTYNAIGTGPATSKWGIPAVYKDYYGWRSSFTCQNVGTVNTPIRITYEGHADKAYTHPTTLAAATNQSVEVNQPNESFLPTGYHGAVTVETTAVGASIACIMNYTNGSSISQYPGDWSMSNNAFPK